MTTTLSADSTSPARDAQSSDIGAIAALHVRAFPGFFLSVLGPRFLVELYTGILQDDTGILLMIDGPEGPQGLVAGTTDPAGFYLRLLRRRWFRMGCASLGAVAKNPSIIRRLIGALRKPGEERQNASGALLMSLAVDPRHRRTGLGCELVKAFAVKAAECGSSQIRLTTDKDHNDSVNRFYLRQGFSISRHYVTPEGREMNEYLLDLKGLGLS